MLNKIFLTSLLMCLSVFAYAEKISETQIYKFKEGVYGTSDVPVELSYPASGQGPFPLIITQHGSTRDGHSFQGRKGKTDEYSRRLMKAATERGYAVAVIDAFYKKGLKGSDKKKFPQAWKYGVQVARTLAQDPRIDAQNVSYTGFSYGAAQANRMLRATVMKDRGFDFAAIAAAEPGCNTIVEPRAYPVPLLVLKGGESHYQTQPCEIMVNLYRDAGMDVSVEIFPKSNHFFSHNGQIVRGMAVNGCPDNPIILTKDGPVWFKDGTAVAKSERRSACMTKTGGKGKSREDLNDVVEAVLSFFDATRR